MLTAFLAAHDYAAMPANVAAAAISFARFVQLTERAFGFERDVQHQAVEAMACREKQELIEGVDAANAANAEAAE